MKNSIIAILTLLFIFIFSLSTSCAHYSAYIPENKVNRIINEDNVDFRLGPSTYYERIGLLKKGTHVEIISFENEWYRAKINNNIGYIKSKYATYCEVFFLDWYENGQSLLVRDDLALNLEYKFTVEDAETGKKFEMLRTGGTNHADVEPLTSNDANIIKNIWKGYNWKRRCIFIHLNGKVYGASMSGMPHAGLDSEAARQYTDMNRSDNYGAGINYDSIKNNGVDGHLDIHLLNSKTHTTNIQDKAHQENINNLMKFYCR